MSYRSAVFLIMELVNILPDCRFRITAPTQCANILIGFADIKFPSHFTNILNTTKIEINSRYLLHNGIAIG